MKRWQFWLGVAVSAAFLYFSLRDLRLDEVWETVRRANYWWVLPGIAVYFLGVWARAWRWHYLLRPLKQISTRAMFPMVAIGYMGNNIYPARAGEVLRSYALKRSHGVPMSASLATIFVERVFDGVVMLMFVFANLPELARLTGGSGFAGSIQALALWGALAFAGALAVFLILAAQPELAARLGTALINRILPERFRDKACGLLDRFLAGLASLRSPREVLMVFVTSLAIWIFETGKYWLVMHAFPIRVSFFALMLMNGIVNLATTIPSAPGYVGTFDAPGIAVLKAYGVDGALAAGYTLVLHVALWAPITALGAWYMARASLSWQEVQQKTREAADAPGRRELPV